MGNRYFTTSAHQRLNCKRINFMIWNCEMITNFINCYTHIHKLYIQCRNTCRSIHRLWKVGKVCRKRRPEKLNDHIWVNPLCETWNGHTSIGQGFKIMRIRDKKENLHKTTVQWRVHLYSDSIFIGVVVVCVVYFRFGWSTQYILLQILM